MKGLLNEIWAEVLTSTSVAIVTVGAIGLLFEWLGKEGIIHEAVTHAVGQSRALELGVNDVVLSASDIDYRRSIETSAVLIISARMSSHFLENNKDRIISRLRAGKEIIFIRMMQGEALDALPGQKGAGPEIFFRKLNLSDEMRSLITMMQTERTLNYNFVCCDDGAWVKLYWNSQRAETPPAIFCRSNSRLFGAFMSDINDLIAHAVRLEL